MQPVWRYIRAMRLAHLALAILLVACGGSPPRPSRTVKIGVVDLRRTLVETTRGKAARAQLEAKKASFQGEIDKGKAALEAEKREPEKARLRGELEARFDSYQAELKTEETRLTREIFTAAGDIMRAIAKRDGYDFIVEKNEQVAIVPPNGEIPAGVGHAETDITDEVNRTLDAP